MNVGAKLGSLKKEMLIEVRFSGSCADLGSFREFGENFGFLRKVGDNLGSLKELGDNLGSLRELGENLSSLRELGENLSSLKKDVRMEARFSGSCESGDPLLRKVGGNLLI